MLEGGEFTVVAREQSMTLVEFAPAVSARLARLGRAASLRIEAGPVIDAWHWNTDALRVRVGARAGASIEPELGRRMRGVLRLDIAVTPSMLVDSDLPEEFARRASVRRAVAIGLMLGR